ncbi:hypothetical protein [Paractinoplanes toevensis]|uniref:Uncharacterized protein n=1 Tax=Paractinoplanes toevensis TaxID=571911 RepID=A0A919TFD3_9ACTN|nr:hypothetical protein [Actinoplanes toevensis]GIM93011.1 hypothetical protein Ato02nite_048040 [Actinoplanes toevensis]
MAWLGGLFREVAAVVTAGTAPAGEETVVDAAIGVLAGTDKSFVHRWALGRR